MADPVSWLVVEQGWEVVDAEGERVGTVHEVVGDLGNDIFSGLSVSPGSFKRRVFVPAEQVSSIEEGRVHLSLSGAQADDLRSDDERPGAEPLAP